MYSSRVVFYVLNYNFEQNLGSLLTLYAIYVIMFKKNNLIGLGVVFLSNDCLRSKAINVIDNDVFGA